MKVIILAFALFHRVSDFYDSVVSALNRNSLFIAVDITADPKAKFIISNQNLYNYYWETQRYSEQRYRKFISNRLRTHKSIDVDTTKVQKVGFIRINSVNMVDSVAKNGRDFFIDFYTRYQSDHKGLTVNVKNAIIWQLFQWKESARLELWSGWLYFGVLN